MGRGEGRERAPLQILSAPDERPRQLRTALAQLEVSWRERARAPQSASAAKGIGSALKRLVKGALGEDQIDAKERWGLEVCANILGRELVPAVGIWEEEHARARRTLGYLRDLGWDERAADLQEILEQFTA